MHNFNRQPEGRRSCGRYALHALASCSPQPCALSLRAEGVKAEEAFEKDGTKPDPNSTDNPEFKIVLGLIRDGLEKNPHK